MMFRPLCYLFLAIVTSPLTVVAQAGVVQRDDGGLPIISISLGLPGGQTSWGPKPTSWGTKPTPTACPSKVTTTVTVTMPCTTSSPPAPTFNCPSEGYNLLPDAETLQAIDITTGVATTIATLDNGGVNAIGYNIIDNTFYARSLQDLTIVHIFRDGSTEAAATLPNGTPAVNLGDVDLNGHYWASSGGTVWFEYDFNPASATFGALLDNGTSEAPPDGVDVNDWATVPSTGPYFYSLVVNGTTGGSAIVRWNSVSHAWERFANYPDIVVDVWGAAWGENNGTLYGTDNTRGTIYNFPLVGNGVPFIVSQGPTTGSEDAARCVLNLTP